MRIFIDILHRHTLSTYLSIVAPLWGIRYKSFIETASGIRDDRVKQINALKIRRHEGLQATYTLRIEAQRERLAGFENRAHNEPGIKRILPAARAKLAKLEHEYEEKISDVDQLHVGGVHAQPIGVGFLKISRQT